MDDGYIDEERASEGGTNCLKNGFFFEPFGTNGNGTNSNDDNKEESHDYDFEEV